MVLLLYGLFMLLILAGAIALNIKYYSKRAGMTQEDRNAEDAEIKEIVTI